MNELLEYKAKFMKIYQEYETYFKVAAKFIFALLTLNSISSGIGYFEVLNLISIRLFIAVVCAFIPVPMVVFVMVAVILLHLFKLSVIFAALAFVVFLLMYLLYLKFVPKQGIYMLAVVALAPFHLDVAVPLIAGMFYTPVAILPIALGIFAAKFLKYIADAATALGESLEIDAIVGSIQSVADGLMGDKEMVLTMIAFAAVVVVVYIVKRLPIDYSWYIAIGAGAVLNVLIFFIGSAGMGAEVSLGGVFIGTIISALIVAAVQFLECTVDYGHKEFLEFEDDDYYYYVRAIPKVGVAEYEPPVKKERAEDASQNRKAAKKGNHPDAAAKKAASENWISDLSEAMEQEGDGAQEAQKLSDMPKHHVQTPIEDDISLPDDFGDFDSFDFDDFGDGESKF